MAKLRRSLPLVLGSLVVACLTAQLASAQFASAQGTDINYEAVKPIELVQVKKNLRVVALANGSAEIVAALGLRSTLVGRDIASTSPEFTSVPIVTSGHQIIPEKVISLKPDVVIVDSTVGPKSAVEVIKRRKIKVVQISDAWNLTDMFKKTSQIGDLMGEKAQGISLINQMKTAIANSRISLGWKPKILFLYLRGPSSIYLIGGKGSGADSLIQELGGIDVGAQSFSQPFSTLTSEALAKVNPDVILVMSKGLLSVGGAKGLLKLPGIKQTVAGKNERILSVDDSLLLSFGPRTPALLVKMAEALRGLR